MFVRTKIAIPVAGLIKEINETLKRKLPRIQFNLSLPQAIHPMYHKSYKKIFDYWNQYKNITAYLHRISKRGGYDDRGVFDNLKKELRDIYHDSIKYDRSDLLKSKNPLKRDSLTEAVKDLIRIPIENRAFGHPRVSTLKWRWSCYQRLPNLYLQEVQKPTRNFSRSSSSPLFINTGLTLNAFRVTVTNRGRPPKKTRKRKKIATVQKNI